MKKILSLTLSLLMVLSIIPMAMSANAETEYTRVLNNFDDLGRLDGPVSFQNGTSGQSGAIFDYTTVDSSYTDGNVLKVVPVSSAGNVYVPLDPSWQIGSPIAVKFQLWAETSTTFDTTRTGIGTKASSISATITTLGGNPTGTRNLPIGTTPEWITYDLTKTTYTNRALGFVFNTSSGFYIDNVTLIYQNAEDVPANLDSYKTMYDWETDTVGATDNGNKFQRATGGAYTSIGSTYCLQVAGTWGSKHSKYISIAMTEDIKDAASLRIALGTNRSDGSNPTLIGVVIEGVAYWFQTEKANISWVYFDFRTLSTSDNSSSIVLTRENISKITEIRVSYNNGTSFNTTNCIDDIQYAPLKASVPQEPAETDGLTTDAVSTDDKASIRLTDEGGIRFYTTFDSSKITGTVEEIGTLIGPSDLVGTYLTNEDVEAGNAVQIPYLADTFWENNQFVGSIAKIKTTNYTRDFVARGYVKVDGVYYYSATTTTRNVRFVADAYIADENSDYATLDNATKAVVDKFATPKA